MNREIEFRGKDLIHNKWIYGGLAEDKEGNAVILPKANWQKGGYEEASHDIIKILENKSRKK